MMTITSNPKEWILDRLKTLDNNKTILVKMGENIHSVFEHSEHGWMFGMSEFDFRPVNEENLEHSFKLFEGNDFTCIILNSKEQLAHEVRSSILMNCVDTLMTCGEIKLSVLPGLVKEVKKKMGSVVRIKHDFYGILTGLCATLEDYYYVITDVYRRIHLVSCVGHLKFMEEDPPVDLLDLQNDIQKLKWIMYSKTSVELNPESFEVYLISI